MSKLAALALVALALAPVRAPAGGMAEAWYLARGRANVKIGNHSAAIEAFQKALEANPSSREASRALASAYLANGETDRAIAQYDRYLARFDDDPDAAFDQARLLSWSRYAYRSGDAIEYLRMGLARRDDPSRRRDLARLLGRDRRTVDEALREYDRLLAAAPGDRGLRAERLKLLLWDPARRRDAIRELEALSAEGKDSAAERQLAVLLADDPKRAGEAADRLAPIVRASPGDAAARHARARALARAGRRAEAREEYERLVARGDGGLDARLERAELLAAEATTRPEARAAYAGIVRDAPASRRARVGYARLLGEQKETSGAAIAQYRAVLAESPADAEAHRGLAHAYAWNGDADRALAHAEQAGPPTGAVAALERDLRAGREPFAGAGARAFAQPTGSWRVSGGGAFASGRAEPTPFTSSAVEIGFETLSGDGATAAGAVLDVRGELRPSVGRRVTAGLAWASARLDGALGGSARWSVEDEDLAWEVGADRRFRRDSLRAYAGERAGADVVGAAAENLVTATARARTGDARVSVGVRGGAVTAAAGPANPVFGATARADVPVLRRGALVVSAGLLADATGYARDAAGLGATPDPLAPRYFSPPLFAAASPRLLVVHDAGLKGRITFDAGPALQVTGGPGGRVQLGGDARIAVSRRVAERLLVGLDVTAERVASAYQRVEGSALAAVLF